MDRRKFLQLLLALGAVVVVDPKVDLETLKSELEQEELPSNSLSPDAFETPQSEVAEDTSSLGGAVLTLADEVLFANKRTNRIIGLDNRITGLDEETIFNVGMVQECDVSVTNPIAWETIDLEQRLYRSVQNAAATSIEIDLQVKGMDRLIRTPCAVALTAFGSIAYSRTSINITRLDLFLQQAYVLTEDFKQFHIETVPGSNRWILVSFGTGRSW